MSAVTPDPARPLWRALSTAVLRALAAPAMLALVAPAMRIAPFVAIALAFLTASTAIVIGTVAAPVARLHSWRNVLGTLAAGMVLMASGYLLSRAGQRAVSWEVLSGLVGSAGVLLAGTAVGSAVGSRIVHPGHLVAVALASSAADIWSVHAPEGVTRALAETPDSALQRLLTVSVAVPPSRVPDAAIGFGDVVFAALYLAASARHGMPRRRTALAIAAGLAVAGAAALVFERPIPALPSIGAAVVLAQPRARAIARGDGGPTLVAGLLLAIAIVRLFLLR